MISILIKLVEVYGEAKEKARKRVEKSKERFEEKAEVEEQKQSGLKRKARKAGLVIARYIVMLVEQLMLWLLAIFGFTGVIVSVFGVLIVVFLMEALAPNEYLIKEEWLQAAKAESEEGLGRPAELQFTEEELAMYGQYYTGYEKNMFRIAILTKATIDGYGTDSKINTILGQDVSKTMFRVFMGVQTTESAWRIYHTKAEAESKDVFTDVSTLYPNTTFRGPYQIGQNWSFSYANISPEMEKIIKQKYPNPQKGALSQYYPYATAVSSAGMFGKITEQKLTSAQVTGVIDEFAPAYGITTDKEKFKSESIGLLMQTAYLSWHSRDTRGIVAFLCGVWAMSSENPEERGWENYALTFDEGLDVTTLNHQQFFGVSGKGWNVNTVSSKGGLRNLAFGSKRTITLNGQPLEKPLVAEVATKYWDKPGMQEYNAQVMGYGGNQYVLKGIYGLESYLIGKQIEEYLTSKVPLSQGGGGGFLDGSGFLEAKPGVIQGSWPDAVKAKMMARGPAWVKTYGTARGVQTPNDPLSGSGMTFEEWRKWSKWKVPWYSQARGIAEPSANVQFGSISRSVGCHVFMSSYIASALTGRLISYGEMFSALGATGGVASNGYYMNASADATFKHLGINWAGVTRTGTLIQGTVPDPVFANLKGSAKDKVDAVLGMNGIVGITTTARSPLIPYGHYYVITEKVGDKYRIYSTAAPRHDVKDLAWEQIVGSGGSYLRKMSDGSSFFLAYNPEINSLMSKGSVDSTQHSGSGRFVGKTNAEKSKILFGTPKKPVYASDIAKSRMDGLVVTKKAKVWQVSGGTKATKEISVTLHKEVIDDGIAILDEIYKHPSKPVLNFAGGYNYRTMNNGTGTKMLSNHSFGAAMDFNVPQNPFPGILGSWAQYKPNKDPLSFHNEHPVVKIFRAHGWGWGGDYNDFMHFELFTYK